MLDSTARAERIDLPSPEALLYTWEVAQKPVAVRLPLPLIDRLESQAVENFRSLSSRGSEIGGLLLGSAVPGSPAVVSLADFELISCEYSRGPLYRLSDADQGRFEKAMEKYASGNGPRVVGFFRSHTRKGLTLDAEDVAFFEPRFHEPHQIVMLIRPFATKVSTAGIFIRENGRLGGEISYREFPFRSSELKGGRGGGEKSESAAPQATAAPTAAQPASPAKPQARAQIVPIASRREIALPEPVVSAATPIPVADEPIEAPAPAPLKAQSVAPVVEKPAAEKPENEREKTPVPAAKVVEPPAKVIAAPAEEAATVIADAEVEVPAPAKKNKKLRLVVAAALGMLALVGGWLVVYPMLMKRGSPTIPVAQDSSPLSLRVERTSGGMLLTWNRDLPVIQNASKVVLSISDGDRHENIQLDPNQVRTGSILYPPITQDVSFQMEVTDGHNAKATSESLRVLDPRPSPLDQPAAAPAAAAKETATPAKPAAADPVSTPAEETKPPEEAPVSHPNLKPFNTASLAQRLRPVSSTDLPEAPVMGRATGPASSGLPVTVGNQPVLPPPPKPASSPTPTSANSNPALPTGGQLVQAKVISRVDPEYPKLARQAGASGVVELEATISVDGKVKNPRVIRGNAMLQKAAIDAVSQWRYKPAMLNGKPVDSPVEIKLNFVAQGH
jgi:protein TonB